MIAFTSVPNSNTSPNNLTIAGPNNKNGSNKMSHCIAGFLLNRNQFGWKEGDVERYTSATDSANKTTKGMRVST
jgi:hypothetical protein